MRDGIHHYEEIRVWMLFISLAVSCNINNVICLKAVLSSGSSNYDSRRGKGLLHLKQCGCSEVHQARHCISESSSGGGSASFPHGSAFACAYWLLQSGGSVLIWGTTLTPIPIILSPEDNDIKDNSLGLSSSLQFSSFAWNHSAWTLYQLGCSSSHR